MIKIVPYIAPSGQTKMEYWALRSMLLNDFSAETLSPNSSAVGFTVGDASKPVILMVGSIHGNEHQSTNWVMEFARRLKYNDYLPWKQYVERLLSKYSFYFVPVVSPWGYQNNSRLNADSIDINRDFHDTKFVTVEAQMIRDVVLAKKPIAYLDNHQFFLSAFSNVDPAINTLAFGGKNSTFKYFILDLIESVSSTFYPYKGKLNLGYWERDFENREISLDQGRSDLWIGQQDSVFNSPIVSSFIEAEMALNYTADILSYGVTSLMLYALHVENYYDTANTQKYSEIDFLSINEFTPAFDVSADIQVGFEANSTKSLLLPDFATETSMSIEADSGINGLSKDMEFKLVEYDETTNFELLLISNYTADSLIVTEINATSDVSFVFDYKGIVVHEVIPQHELEVFQIEQPPTLTSLDFELTPYTETGFNFELIPMSEVPKEPIEPFEFIGLTTLDLLPSHQFEVHSRGYFDHIGLTTLDVYPSHELQLHSRLTFEHIGQFTLTVDPTSTIHAPVNIVGSIVTDITPSGLTYAPFVHIGTNIVDIIPNSVMQFGVNTEKPIRIGRMIITLPNGKQVEIGIVDTGRSRIKANMRVQLEREQGEFDVVDVNHPDASPVRITGKDSNVYALSKY